MWFFRLLTLCVIAILFCGIMSESLSLTDISLKLDYIINDLKEKDILDGCEVLPEDKNVVSTVIGLKLYENPEYIRKNFYANFRCKDPSSFQFRGGPKTMKCNGPDSETIVNPQCVPLKNESEWQAVMHKLDLERGLCLNGSLKSESVYKNPLSRFSYFRCYLYRLFSMDEAEGYHFKSEICPGEMEFDNNLKRCVMYSKSDEIDGIEFTDIGLTPSIVVHATGSAWDSLGWLLVERGSKVTLDCVYPHVKWSNALWYKSDFGNSDEGPNIHVKWLSKFRKRIVLDEVDYSNTGIYTCQGVYYSGRNKHGSSYLSELKSHAITIALKEKRCPETPLPDFELHHKYYTDYLFMKRIKKRCLETS